MLVRALEPNDKAEGAEIVSTLCVGEQRLSPVYAGMQHINESHTQLRLCFSRIHVAKNLSHVKSSG